MTATLITYADKVNNASSVLPANKKVRDVDMNEIKDAVNDNAALHDSLQAEHDLLELRAGAVPFQWKFSTLTTASDPSAGYFRLNGLTPATSTAIYMSKEEVERDVSDIMNLIQVNSYVFLQSRRSDKYSLVAKILSITDNTTWIRFDISVVDAYSTANFDADFKFAFSFLNPAASGGGGSAVWGTITGTLSAQTDLQTELDEIGVNASNIADLEAVVTQRALYSATTTGTVALDCSTFDSWYRILTGNTAFTFTSTPASGTTFVRTLEVITTAGESLTFPTADNVIGTFINDDVTVNLITINFANYPTLGLRITVVIS